MPQTRPGFSRIAEFLQQQNVSMALTTSLSQLAKTRENQTQSFIASPCVFPLLAPVARQDAGLATVKNIDSHRYLATQIFLKDHDKTPLLWLEYKLPAQMEAGDAVYWTFCFYVIFQVPPEVARRRISFSEPEKMNFVGRKMTTLSIK